MELLNLLLSNLWAVLLIVLFFGGSIFVHELGHFLAARRRGMHVERFSIGFGPRMFGWRGKDGVEYRVSWLPLGGYVALPQLADLKGLEGEVGTDVSKLPPAGYADKMIVAVAGAVFNVLFAIGLAFILWGIGQYERSDMATREIGYVVRELTLSDNTRVTSPALEAGLQVGDIIEAIDGRKMEDWQDIRQTLLTGAGRTGDGRRIAVFSILRDGKPMEIVVHPRLAGPDEERKVGIDGGYELRVLEVEPNSIAAAAGVQAGDRLLSLGGVKIRNFQTFLDVLRGERSGPLTMDVAREKVGNVTLSLAPHAGKQALDDLGLSFTTDRTLVYPTPIRQVKSHLSKTWQVLTSLVNPRSDVGLDKMSGPVGIIRVFHMAAQADFRLVLWFTILVNINLAVFNLLPIPVLDGGHMLFATIGKLRGRALPPNFIAATQSVFVVLLFSMVLYVTFFDVRRIFRDHRPPPATEQAETEK